MYQSFELLLQSIWFSLDDIFICLCAFVVARVVAGAIYWCLNSYFDIDAYECELVQFIFLGIVVVFLISHLFGETAVTSILGGFSIGIGYALQPYIISFLAGSTLRATNTLTKGKIIIFNEQKLTVEHLGLLYVCATHDGIKTYIPNAYFQSAPLSVEEKHKS
tara:strand:- start:4274 stop:4762 length:489 start_codon:yes stop_codon:yes gene_type:complete